MAPAHLPRAAARASALLAALSLALTGCSAADDGTDPQPAPDGASESADAPPAIVEEDGYYRSNTLPAPLTEQAVTLPTETGTGSAKLQIVSLDSNGEFVRLVGAWLQPVDGEGLASDTLTSSAESVGLRPWVRLIDRETGTLLEPLQHDGGSAQRPRERSHGALLPRLPGACQRRGRHRAR